MSHFSVGVLVSPERLADHDGDVESAVTEMMAPYQENNMGDCPEEYIEFIDVTEEERSNYEDRKEEYVADGYDTFEKYIEEYCGYEYNEVEGGWGYYENPNRKWDWWSIGGRWRNMLQLKQGAALVTSGTGELSTFDRIALSRGEDIDIPEGTADYAKISDIDWAGMNAEVDNTIKDFYNLYILSQKYQPLFNEIKANLDDSVEKDKIYEVVSQMAYEQLDLPEDCKFSKDDIAKADFSQSWTLAELGLRQVKQEDGKDVLDENGKRVVETLPFTLEDLLTTHRHYWEFGTFALLNDEGWQSKGEMGWFGMSSDTPEDGENWNKSYMDFIKQASDDTIFVVVDCHI